ncbi:unnamed protein product, partial [Tenebrio molitor]
SKLIAFLKRKTDGYLPKKSKCLEIEDIEKFIINFFFTTKKKNKCTRQPVGIHSFGDMPSKIATFLKLENPKQYTGHCFRRSSATVLAGHGADITTIKRHGG